MLGSEDCVNDNLLLHFSHFRILKLVPVSFKLKIKSGI